MDQLDAEPDPGTYPCWARYLRTTFSLVSSKLETQWWNFSQTSQRLSNTSTNISLGIVLLRVPENFRSQENWNWKKNWWGNTLSELLNRWASVSNCQGFVVKLIRTPFPISKPPCILQRQICYLQHLGNLRLLAVTECSGQWKMGTFITLGPVPPLRAADQGLSGQDAFAQWHSFDPKNITWQNEKVIIFRYPRGVTTDLLDV